MGQGWETRCCGVNDSGNSPLPTMSLGSSLCPYEDWEEFWWRCRERIMVHKGSQSARASLDILPGHSAFCSPSCILPLRGQTCHMDGGQEGGQSREGEPVDGYIAEPPCQLACAHMFWGRFSKEKKNSSSFMLTLGFSVTCIQKHLCRF